MLKIRIKKNHKTMRWLLIIITTSLIIGTFLLALGFALHKYYNDKYIYGLSAAHIKIGNMEKEKVNKSLQLAIDNYRLAGVEYNYNGHTLHVDTAITSPELET